MNVGFISDLHLEHNNKSVKEAEQVIHKLCKRNDINKLFIVGDTSNDYRKSLDLAENLSNLGVDTYTLFGNHEYFSIKYEEARLLKNDRYFANKITELTKDIAIVSVDGFFDYSFVTEVQNKYTKNLPDDKYLINKLTKDSSAIRKPNIGNFSEVFDSMEDKLIELLDKASKEYKNVYMVLHYSPSEEFIIYKESNTTWNLRNSFMGSVRYKELAEEYKVNKVIFGHTHNLVNKEVNNISYHCNPIGYRGVEFTEPFDKRVEKVFKTIEL